MSLGPAGMDGALVEGSGNENASGAIAFEDLFDLDEVQQHQDLFAKATGVACHILRPDGTFITEPSNFCRLCSEIIRGNEKGAAKCIESDSNVVNHKTEGMNIYRCGSVGLLEAVVPIHVGGRHIATWCIGQVSDGTQTEEGIRAYAREIGVDEDIAAEAFNDVTVMSPERFDKVVSMMHVVANQFAAIGYQSLQQARLLEEQKRTKEELAQFEWLLEKEGYYSDGSDEEYVSPYSDVTELNTRRVILDTVGKELLASMAHDLMDLLDTSVAVYEVNGDYAYGVFTSCWCRVLDGASFRMCGSDNTKEALNSGKWLCHECCWNQSAKVALESGEATDIECVGGIRLYAVPIRVEEELVGVVSIGYGTPPSEDYRLQELAENFGLEIHDVRRASEKYRPRPRYIIDAAKRRCRSIAHHIGEIVQRRRTQNSLEERERQLSSLLGNLPGMAYRCLNKQGCPMIFVSDGCFALTGFAPVDFVCEGPKSYIDLIHPEDQPIVWATIQDAVHKEEPFVLEYRIRNKQGRERWVWEQGHAVGKDADGVAVIEGFISDITERKVAETALVREQNRLRLASDAAQFGVWDLDLKNNKFVWDEWMFRLYGLDPETFGGGYECWQKRVHPEDLERASSEVEKAIAEGKPLDTEFRVVHPDGTVRRLKAYATVSCDEQGQPVRMTGVNYDITELSFMQSRLEESEAHYRLLADNTLDVIWTMDIDLKFTYVNPSIYYLTGHRQEEWVDTRLSDHCTQSSFEYMHKVIEKEISLGPGHHRGVIFESELVCKDGSTLDVEIHGKVTFNSNGEPYMLQGTTRDISQRKKAEEALQKERDRLDYVIEASHLGTWAWNIKENTAEFNEMWATQLGYTMDEIGPSSYELWKSLGHPDDIPEIEKLLGQCASGEALSYSSKFRMRHKDGHWVWLLDRGRVMTYDADGKPLEMFGTHTDITAIKEAEEELKASEKRYRALFEQAGDYCMVLDPNTPDGIPVIVEANEAAYIMHGYTREEFIGRPVADIDDADGRRLCRERTRQIMTGKPFHVENTHVRKDGSTFEVSVHANRIDIEGSPPLILTTEYDITDRKRAEEEARSAHDRLEVAMAGGGLGAWEWAVPTGEMVIDARWQTMLGYRPGEIGLRLECVEALTDPDMLPRLKELMEAHLEGKTPFYEAVYRMKHKDGHWVWIHDRGQVTKRDDNGAPLRVCGVHADVTPLMQAEEELRQSEAKFRSYVEQAPFGVIIADATGQCVEVNPAASQITGYEPDELLSMRVVDMLPSEEQEAGEVHFARVVEKGYAEGLLPFVQKNGTRGVWNVTAVRLNRDCFLGFVQDVTKRHEMEKQLQKSQRLDAVGQLAGGIAHDFNNLLMGIMGYTQLCLDEIDDDHPIREWLEEVLHEAQRSADIVRQLLAFSRKQTIAPLVLDLNDAVAKMLKMLRRLIGEDIDLLWQPGANLWEIKIDPGQVDQILANLCVNARDAIGGVGKITIETANRTLDADYCATQAEAEPGDYVMLAVSDNGSGMDAETMAKVFEPFFTTKADGEGTGLGLATVYGIVKQNGGSINLLSEPGVGTTIRIYLPCVEGIVDEEVTSKASEDDLTGNETILVVEDEEAIRLTTAFFLKRLGYCVLTVGDPKKAMEMVTNYKGRIDILMTDVVMPGMNGRELADQLVAMYPGLKVLFVSGYTADVIAHRGVLEEGVNFLSKPITRKNLARKLRDILDGRT